MNLDVETYDVQKARWSQTGRVILAQFDANSIVVYQAYRPEIGDFAARHGYFGDEFKSDRMTWIKPNFLWMMYRSGWGTKDNQEVVLAVRIWRSAFDEILRDAVHSSFNRDVYGDEVNWRRCLTESDVRLQWDPDHDPMGKPIERRVIQLGLRGKMVSKYARDWIVSIEDVSAFVAEQWRNVRGADQEKLVMPREEVYPVVDISLAQQLGIC